MILPGFRRRSQARIIAALYGAVVAQARCASFYTDYGVPDTVEGRFDLIVLHLVLLLRRLGQESGKETGQEARPETALGSSLGQDLFDEFCRDLDANLREMGVGDLAVPKRMQRFGEAFYGRQSAYCEALSLAVSSAVSLAELRDFEKALARNIYQGRDGDDAARLAQYARAVVVDLDAQRDDALNRGEVGFLRPEVFAREKA
jgi:cytochrome b pre-mRNA-processing protein 3